MVSSLSGFCLGQLQLGLLLAGIAPRCVGGRTTTWTNARWINFRTWAPGCVRACYVLWSWAMKHDTAHVRAHGWRAHARVPFAICPQMYFCYSSLAIPFRGCTGLTELASVNAQREMLGHFSSANDVKPTDSRLASSVLPRGMSTIDVPRTSIICLRQSRSGCDFSAKRK